MTQRVSQIAAEVLKKYDECMVCVYSAGRTDDIFAQAWPSKQGVHPLDKAKKVLDAIDKESKRPGAMFEKSFFDVWGHRIRCMTLKELCARCGKGKAAVYDNGGDICQECYNAEFK